MKEQINRDCRIYREMFSHLQEKAQAMVGEEERGSLHVSDGRTISIPEGATLEGECGDLEPMFLWTYTK